LRLKVKRVLRRSSRDRAASMSGDENAEGDAEQ
jgi:hypothetical protein